MNILLHVISLQKMMVNPIVIQVNYFNFITYLFHRDDNVKCKETILV